MLPSAPFPLQCRDYIARRGLRLIETGPLPSYLPTCDWHPDSCMGASDEHRMMFIMCVHAREEGRGSFRRLVNRLRRDGWTVVVVMPLARMAAICERMGFSRSEVNGVEVMLIEGEKR